MSVKALDYTMKAFKLRKVKRETLILAFEQIKPLLERYMKENYVSAIRLDLETKHLSALEPISNAERHFWLEEWLNSEISTRQLKKRMKQHYHWVEYVSFSDFLSGVESWLRGVQHG